MEQLKRPKHPSARSRGAQAHLIKAGRLQLGMTQKQLAKHLGVHVQTIAHFESGRQRPGAGTIARMAELFGIPADRFYYADHRIPPDMQAYIERNPKLMQQIRQLMERQGAVAQS